MFGIETKTLRWALAIALSGATLGRFVDAPPVLAATVVTNCANQTQLQTALTAGSDVTFNCGVATIPITTTLTANSSVTIDGGGLITLDGGNARPILTTGGATVTVKNLTFAHGRRSGSSGGAIQVGSFGTLTVSGSTFLSNTVTSGGTGGAIYAPPVSILSVTASTFLSNTGDYGGAIFAQGIQTISGTAFLTNTALISGGAYEADIATTITNSTFQNNQSRGNGDDLYGGGAVRALATASVTNSTFRYNNSQQHGGGLYASGDVTITGSTFQNNLAIVTGSGSGMRTNGTATVAGSLFTGNHGGGPGAGFWAGGAANVSSSTFSLNSGLSGGGFLTNGPATVADSSFEFNQSNDATFGGGGFYAGLNSATVTRSRFVGNGANRSGGGFNAGLTTVSDSTFLTNTGLTGGGFAVAGAVTVTNSTLNGNRASNFGGGFWATGPAVLEMSTVSGSLAGSGAGMVVDSLSVLNSTITGNEATFTGGAAISATKAITIDSSTIADNPSGGGAMVRSLTKSLVISASILAGTGSPYCAAATGITLQFGNLIQAPDSSCGSTPPITTTNPLLGPLTNNGGATPTRALLAGSPAIGAATGCANTDQRSLVRVAPCDLGAYETGLKPNVATITPTTAIALDPGFQLAVFGDSFVPGSVVLWNGAPLSTTVVYGGQLAADVPTSLLTISGVVTVQARYGDGADSVSAGLPFTITKRTQTIDFAPLADRPLSASPFTVTATASSGLVVTFSSGGACTNAAASVTLTGPGSCTIAANQPGDGAFAAATPVSRTFTVTGQPAPPEGPSVVFASAIFVNRPIS